MTRGATWITRLEEGRSGLRVGVKDLIDVAGVPTTAGCQAVARWAEPAVSDAACLAGLRMTMSSGGARLVGKTNLHELADGLTGINAWSGTPVNPLDTNAVPGGSSSGSAVAVATGEADVAYGTDTAGSVRIPAACCGVAGLKTSRGRVSLAGVWPLAPSFDTVGPMARDLAGVIAGMDLLEPGFAASVLAPVGDDPVIGRIRLDHLGIEADPAIDAAVDRALAAAGFEVRSVRPAGWAEASRSALVVIGAESFALHGGLVQNHADQIGADVTDHFAHAAAMGHQRVRQAGSALQAWEASFWSATASGCSALALPTMGVPAPPIGPDAARQIGVAWTLPVSAAGLPALALPLRGAGGMASIQLIGRPFEEARLCRLGQVIEGAGRRCS